MRCQWRPSEGRRFPTGCLGGPMSWARPPGAQRCLAKAWRCVWGKWIEGWNSSLRGKPRGSAALPVN